jgi:superoxide dismutase, Cu-Zn family
MTFKNKQSLIFKAVAASLAIAAAAVSTGCATTSGPSATAQLQATKNNTANGIVTFTQKGNYVLVNVDIKGLKPNADHGFHVHDKGDCSSDDGLSAGPHFNPNTENHGAHDAEHHHAGDLPSLKADAAGTVKFSFQSKSLAVGTGMTDVVGRGLIVHKDPDDFKTQPTGNSGARIACGVIKLGASGATMPSKNLY